MVNLEFLLDTETVDIPVMDSAWYTLAEIIMVEAGQGTKETPEMEIPHESYSASSRIEDSTVI